MKKGLHIILCLSLCFVFLMAGVYLGRNTIDGDLTIEASRQKSNTPEDPSIFNDQKININTAGVEEFSLLHGIGETLASRIVDYRAAHGDYQKIEDLLNVEGIGEVRLAQIAKYITVGD